MFCLFALGLGFVSCFIQWWRVAALRQCGVALYFTWLVLNETAAVAGVYAVWDLTEVSCVR